MLIDLLPQCPDPIVLLLALVLLCVHCFSLTYMHSKWVQQQQRLQLGVCLVSLYKVTEKQGAKRIKQKIWHGGRKTNQNDMVHMIAQKAKLKQKYMQRLERQLIPVL